MKKIKVNKNGVATISITDIVRDKKFQGRTKLDKSTLKKYTQMYLRGQKLDPVEITLVDKKGLILTDGWHRVRASELAGRDTVEAVIKQGDKRKAFQNAITANLRHGLQVKNADKRLLFKMYMESGQYSKGNYVKSLREIAEDFNQQISHMTVKRWMKKMFRFTYQHSYSGEGEGNMKAEGFQPIQISEEPETFFEIASEAINKVRLVFDSVEDVRKKGKLLWEMEALVEKIKRENEFTPYDLFDEYYQHSTPF